MKDAIAKHGFRIVQDGVGDLATAFVAEYGKGKPVVGILAEYDALPGLGNAAQPREAPGPTGTATGHEESGRRLLAARAAGQRLGGVGRGKTSRRTVGPKRIQEFERRALPILAQS